MGKPKSVKSLQSLDPPPPISPLLPFLSFVWCNFECPKLHIAKTLNGHQNEHELGFQVNISFCKHEKGLCKALISDQSCQFCQVFLAAF